MGRRPKPTTLKLLTGNPGKRKLPANEPIDASPARKPAYLAEPENAKASQLWDEYAPALIAMGTLTLLSSPMFAAWCCLEAQFRRDPNAMTAALIGKKKEYEVALGMDPGARARLQAPAKPKSNAFGELAG